MWWRENKSVSWRAYLTICVLACSIGLNSHHPQGRSRVQYAAMGGNRYVVIKKTIPELRLSTSVWNGKRPQTSGGGGDEGTAQREEGSGRYEGDVRGGLGGEVGSSLY
ncbi:hypothetical protein DFH09DRAFT_595835 [Mycena vulgaris]|nr:hypothetical protein DFH09DRAFT_595835 [Mycena vulgaris]